MDCWANGHDSVNPRL